MIHVTGALNPVPPVYFVATVSAVAADEAIKAGFDRGHRVFRFAQNPDLDHVSGFPVVARVLKPGGDDHTGVILVEDVAVHSTPPLKRAMIACRFDSLWSRDRFVRR